MTEDDKYEFVLTTPTEESPPPPAYSRTWGNDSAQDDSKRRNWGSSWKWKTRWNWSLQDGSIASYRTAKQTVTAVSNKARLNFWPFLKKIRFTKKQCFALLLVITCGIVPFVVLGILTAQYNNSKYVMFFGIFKDKVLSCGNTILDGTPQNATVSGIEKLFVLDYTFGQFTFSQVKIIDVAWDILVGRGVQILAWWAGYVVFSDSLLRAIERHPASFRIFQRIALEGPSLLSVWTLIKEVWGAKSKRTKALFFYMFLSTCNVLCVPLMLGAMTGYDSTNIAWVSLEDADNIVPAATLKQSWVIAGTKNQTFDRNVCQDYQMQYRLDEYFWARNTNCRCQLKNGTIIPADQDMYTNADTLGCKYDYPGNTETYVAYIYSENAEKVRDCKGTFDVKINGVTYDAQNLNGTSGYCYNSVGYEAMTLYDKSRCLPDTANPSYQWGFSTMMSAIFIFIQLVWCLTMYAVWQDAQFNSSLVKSGYEMTILRAAFAMAKAAKRKTGLGERQLVRADTREMEQELYGNGRTQGTHVEYGLFVDDPEGGDGSVVVRRSVQPKYEPD